MPVPLTHHEILALAAPFSRRGLSVDLSATRRAQRRLVFRPSFYDVADLTAVRSTLSLDAAGRGTYRLTRTLECRGRSASLRTVGTDVADLLDAVEAFPPHRQFRNVGGVVVAFSYDLDAGRKSVLTRATADAGAVELVLAVPTARGVAAEITIYALDGRSLALPEDLLAVLGWDWSPIERVRSGWRGRLRLRGAPEQRGRRAQSEFERAAAHVAQTLSEPPARFHDRMRLARWQVVARRGIPSLTVLALAVAVGSLPRILAEPRPATLMLLFHVPTVVIALSFCLQERAKFELPPRPRRSDAPDWLAPPSVRDTVPSPMRWWKSPFR